MGGRGGEERRGERRRKHMVEKEDRDDSTGTKPY